MTANMTEARFAESELHQKVLKACTDALVNVGQFRKARIMDEVNDAAMIDSVRWDWIVRKIRKGNSMPSGKVELIAVAESFFKADRKKKAAMHVDYVTKESDSFPGKYVAQGCGKRTAGWVLATFAEGRFALYKAELMRKNSDGKKRNLEDFAATTTNSLKALGENGQVNQIAAIAGIKRPRLTKSK